MHESRPLTFDTMLRDPLIRAVMRSDRVSVAELVGVLDAARRAVAARERKAVRRMLARRDGGTTAAVAAGREPP